MGGAIMLTLVDAEVINSTFENNKAIADGGAIGFIGGNVKIEGCIFTNNTSEGSSIVGGQAATVNISTSIFTDNSAAAIVSGRAGNYMTVNNNIFINNNGTAIDFEDPDSNVDYNWFGHNQSNYKDEPGIKGCSKWLFLNATVNPTEISIDQNSIIAFKLDSYDNSSGDVDPFDASKLNLILDLTQTLGELDKTTALIGENITYTAKQGGNARITGKYETSSYTIELNNVKLPTEISIANSTIALKANEEADAGATLNPDGAGNLTYTSNNSKVAIVENGKIKALSNGTATITVSFEGNDQYDAAANKTIDVTVSLNDASVSVNNSTLDLFVGDTFTIVATTVPDDLNVTYVPDNAGVVSVDENGVVTALKNGTATIVVKVGDGKVYAENSTIVSVTVNKIPTEIIVEQGTADLNVGDEFNPVVSLMPSNVGNLSFQSDDADVALVNGYGIITAVGEGEATITVSFSGNKKYAAAESKNITVTVSKVPTEISAEGCELFVDDNATISYVLIPEDAEGDVRFMSNDSSVVYADAETGVVVGRGEGTATVSVTYFGDDKYASSTANVTVTVSKVPTEISAEGCELFVDDNVTISYVLIPEDAEGDVRFMSNDTGIVYADAETGVVVARGAGTATVSVTYFGNDKYESSTTNVTVTVSKIPTEIAAEGCELFVDDNVTISYVLIPEDAEGDVRFMSNDSSVVYADAETGIIVGRAVGTATVSISFFGDDRYESSSTNVTVTVSLKDASVVADPDSLELFVGETGKFYTTTTPEDLDIEVSSSNESVATVELVNRVPTVTAVGEGSAVITVTINEKVYVKNSTTVDVTVRKIPTEITAEGCELYVDDNATISYKLIPEDAEGDVRFMSNDSSVVYADAETGIIVGRGEGTATVSVTYFGDDKYASSSTNVTVTVNKIPTEISAEGCELYVDDNATISYVLIPEDAEGDVRFMSNDSSVVYADAETGVVVARGAGTATVSVSYFGNDKYAPSNTTVKVVVNKLNTTLVTKYENGTIYATVTDAHGNPVSGIKVGFAVNGVKYVISDENGQANYTIGDWGPGYYSVKVMAYGNDLYETSNQETVVVTKEQSKIYLRNALYFVTDTKIVKVTLWGGKNKPIAGKTVHIKVYDSLYSGVTDKNGNAYIRVGIGFGVHNATVIFDGNYQYAASNRTGQIKVIRETPSIMVRGADQKFKVSDNPKTVKVYLWDRNSKPLPVGSKVAIKINGQTYVGLTDSNGIASININVNAAGVYDAELKYGGNSAYNAVTRKVKITIS